MIPTLHQTTIEVVRPIPDHVGAGVPATLTLRVRCSAGCRISDAPVRLVDASGAVLDVNYAAGPADGEVDAVVTAPACVGEVAWLAVCARHARESGVHEESAPVEVRFRAVAHTTSMAVWDVPSPVTAGSALSATVGVRCTEGCALTGAQVRVWDESGACVGDGRLGTTPWGGTAALHWAEIALTAPTTEGLTVRRAALAPDTLALPHDAADASFTFMTTPRPEHQVEVTVVDTATGAGLADVEVRVGLYPMRSDAAGSARVEVPRGTYEIWIRKDGFSAKPIEVSVTADLAVRVEAQKVPTMAERAETLSSFEGFPWG